MAGALTPRQSHYVGRIMTSSRHLLGLVNDVLDMARIEAGRMTVRAESARIESALAAAVGIVAPLAASAGITIERGGTCGEDLCFSGDADRVRQIVLNLLSNAVKFTPRGGHGTLGCRVSAHGPAGPAAGGPDGDWVVVDVEDTGEGIAEADLDRIFDAFVQLASGHTRPADGAGLGLTISRRFARMMRGDITVQSRPGEASCFPVWLPRAPDAADSG